MNSIDKLVFSYLFVICSIPVSSAWLHYPLVWVLRSLHHCGHVVLPVLFHWSLHSRGKEEWILWGLGEFDTFKGLGAQTGNFSHCHKAWLEECFHFLTGLRQWAFKKMVGIDFVFNTVNPISSLVSHFHANDTIFLFVRLFQCLNQHQFYWKAFNP